MVGSNGDFALENEVGRTGEGDVGEGGSVGFSEAYEESIAAFDIDFDWAFCAGDEVVEQGCCDGSAATGEGFLFGIAFVAADCKVIESEDLGEACVGNFGVEVRMGAKCAAMSEDVDVFQVFHEAYEAGVFRFDGVKRGVEAFDLDREIELRIFRFRCADPNVVAEEICGYDARSGFESESGGEGFRVA